MLFEVRREPTAGLTRTTESSSDVLPQLYDAFNGQEVCPGQQNEELDA
jgi:hypothetical protein